jgi:transcriptional regulator with XRE-family HTH domain
MTLKEYRISKHFTLAQLAAEMGISTGYLSHLEKGYRRMSEDLVTRMAKALDVPAKAIREEAEKTNNETALSKSWISHIRINGYPLFQAFKFQVSAQHSTIDADNLKGELVKFIVNNIAYSVTAEIESKKDIVPTLVAQLKGQA